MNKDKLKQVVLGVIAIDFPLIYVGAVTLENAVVTTLGLIIMGAAAVVAAVVY